MKKLIQNRISMILSIIFHPLVMPTLGIAAIFYSDYYFYYYPFEVKKVVMLIVLVGTLVLPLCFIPFFYFAGIIKNIRMKTKRERLYPLIITIILYIITFNSLQKIYVPEVIKSFILASAITVIITTLLTLKWKISAHMIGAGGLTGLITALMIRHEIYNHITLIIAIFLAGIIGYARLWLKEHKYWEVYAGYAVGLVSVMTGMIFI